MRRLLVIFAFFICAAPAYAQPAASQKISRRHFRVVSADNDTYEWSELVYSGDVGGIVSLWRGSSGELLVFRESEVYVRGTMNFSVSDPARKLFIQGVLHLPYAGKTPAEAKKALTAVPAEAYEVSPFTMAAGSYHTTAPYEHWHADEGASKRAEFRQHLQDAALRMVKKNMITAAGLGNIAAGAVCGAILDILNEGAAESACRHDRRVQPEMSGPDCDFDAKFGYPCSPLPPG
jgi:hypothetical protein